MTTTEPDEQPDFEEDDDDALPSYSAAVVFDQVNDGGPNQPVQVALRPDGSALRLTGPGSGSMLNSGSSDSYDARIKLLTRDEALDNPAPVMLIHKPHNNSDLVPSSLARIVSATQGQVALGVVAPLPRSTRKNIQDWLSSCATASLLIADPMGFRLDTSFLPGTPPSPRSVGWWPYLASDPLDVADVLDAQRQVGANLLLSPGRGVDPADPQRSLNKVFAEADQALAQLQEGERLALNLTMPKSWLSQEVLRDQLLDQLLDQEQFDVWYIRVQLPSALRSTEQPTDPLLIRGYKRLAQLASDEERKLLLPQTGLTGWLQLAFGATGFGSGLPGSDQAFKEPAGGGGGAAPIERYFEPTLLHSVVRDVHETLRGAASYQVCPCPYCPALHASADWRPDLAALHQLHWMGWLTANASVIDHGGPSGAIRRIVRKAIAAAKSQPLAGLSEPRHLPVWDQVL